MTQLKNDVNTTYTMAWQMTAEAGGLGDGRKGGGGGKV